MTLTAFLLARIAEDEDTARRLDAQRRFYVCDDGHVEEPDGEWADGTDHLPNHHNTWALMYDPMRVLAECAAKRRIIALHRCVDGAFFGDDDPYDDRNRACSRCGTPDEYAAPWPCKTLLALTQPYSDHPDFDPSWLVGETP